VTTPSGAEQARAKRRRRLQERQAVVFGLLLTSLLLAAVGALLVFTGAVASPFDRGFTTAADDAPYADVKPPCLPPDTRPALPTEIQVTVLNSSDRKGLAGAIAQELTNRGFSFAKVGNIALDPKTKKPVGGDTGRTQIRFGPGGIAQAYTIAAQFEQPAMLLDARPANADGVPDATVTVIVGTDFEDMVPPDKTGIDAAIPLQSPKNCVAIEKLTPIPTLPTPTPTEGDGTQG
jgi:hypothetical protein